MRGTRHAVLACLLALGATPVTGAAQTGWQEAVERAGEAVERAMETMGLALERAFADPAPEVRESWSQEARDFRWTGTLAEGRTLEIKGVNGPVTVERASGREVEVSAQLRGRRNDPDEVRIERVEHAGGITFCAVYPTPRGERENRCAPGDEGRMNVRRNDVEVRFTVRLPAGVPFSGRTVNGSVEALELESDVALRSVNGDVRVSTTGHAAAQTVNGSIEARMGTVGRAGLSFETVNGSIDLDLPDDVDADVDARWVNGGLDTDLPFLVRGRMGRRSAEGALGDGGPLLKLATVNGSIRLR